MSAELDDNGGGYIDEAADFEPTTLFTQEHLRNQEQLRIIHYRKKFLNHLEKHTYLSPKAKNHLKALAEAFFDPNNLLANLTTSTVTNTPHMTQRYIVLYSKAEIAMAKTGMSLLDLQRPELTTLTMDLERINTLVLSRAAGSERESLLQRVIAIRRETTAHRETTGEGEKRSRLKIW